MSKLEVGGGGGGGGGEGWEVVGEQPGSPRFAAAPPAENEHLILES